jgi:exonuclease VII large subunit
MSTEEDSGGAQTVEQKLDTLSASMDRRFDTLSASVDERFDTLSASVDERFDTLSASVDHRFDVVDQRFDEVTTSLVEQRQYTEFAFDRLAGEMRVGFKGVDKRLDRLERKLDQFIDTQSKANQLVERRLQALEPEPGNP